MLYAYLVRRTTGGYYIGLADDQRYRYRFLYKDGLSWEDGTRSGLGFKTQREAISHLSKFHKINRTYKFPPYILDHFKKYFYRIKDAEKITS